MEISPVLGTLNSKSSPSLPRKDSTSASLGSFSLLPVRPSVSGQDYGTHTSPSLVSRKVDSVKDFDGLMNLSEMHRRGVDVSTGMTGRHDRGIGPERYAWIECHQ